MRRLPKLRAGDSPPLVVLAGGLRFRKELASDFGFSFSFSTGTSRRDRDVVEELRVVDV